MEYESNQDSDTRDIYALPERRRRGWSFASGIEAQRRFQQLFSQLHGAETLQMDDQEESNLR